MKTIVGVMGPGERATEQDCDRAYRLGRSIAENGWILLSGGRNAGVMDAVSRGAKEAGGLTVGILPSADKQTAVSSAVDIAIVTGQGSARNNINVLSADVVIACGLEAGTVSEIALAIKARKDVILLCDDDEGARFLERLGRGKVRRVADVAEAITAARSILGASPNAGLQ